MLVSEPADEPCSQFGFSLECRGLKKCGTLFGISSSAHFHTGDINMMFLRCVFQCGFADSISPTFSLHKLCKTSPHLVLSRNFPQENQYRPPLWSGAHTPCLFSLSPTPCYFPFSAILLFESFLEFCLGEDFSSQTWRSLLVWAKPVSGCPPSSKSCPPDGESSIRALSQSTVCLCIWTKNCRPPALGSETSHQCPWPCNNLL